MEIKNFLIKGKNQHILFPRSALPTYADVNFPHAIGFRNSGES